MIKLFCFFHKTIKQVIMLNTVWINADEALPIKVSKAISAL